MSRDSKVVTIMMPSLLLSCLLCLVGPQGLEKEHIAESAKNVSYMENKPYLENKLNPNIVNDGAFSHSKKKNKLWLYSTRH